MIGQGHFISVWHSLTCLIAADTSRPIRAGEVDGDGYWYVTKDRMEDEIASGKFLEWGEFDGHLYGTKLDEIRRVIEKGKMCILDLNPTVCCHLVVKGINQMALFENSFILTVPSGAYLYV